ncbi:type VI secretion system baseplate subunit TssG [[Erwinia] mediterraneensis]|uniref:type VI secretion system baseplate subunit TssG n=1 Tax=[Erwinia] mediterraneensis TaxID=2161819 RepID=UPI001EEF2137|nr:type VI secretion system baseplate subunit TssG [[Erwinia] mediterraneensis]
MRTPPDTSANPGVRLPTWYQKDAPWKVGFISLLRALAAWIPGMPAPGKATRPSQEPFRLGQVAHMAFAPSEIAQISEEQNKLKIDLFGLGVWGPQGAMPLHLSELAYSRSEQYDRALADFMDIFHHRALTLFYRAWFISQDTASLDRKSDERFSFYIGSLAGLDPADLDGNLLPVHARLASTAHLIREARNPEGLTGALQYYFDIPVSMEEYSEQWLFLDEKDQSILGQFSSAMVLGDGAILGNAMQDRQHKFSLILGPLNLRQYMLFSPWGNDLPTIREWVRNFTGFEYAWDIQLILAADEIPQATLDGTHQLGYATWLAKDEKRLPVFGMSFEPENYH